jgi:rhodanese-related sulfurtransferase
MNQVTEIAPAPPDVVIDHYRRLLQLETDCWDVHAALATTDPGFVLLDIRSRAMFETAHIAGAVHLPYGKINERALAAYPEETLFVVYCNGPHCNGADRAALALALQGRHVKKMIGGVHGWRVSGFPIEEGASA